MAKTIDDSNLGYLVSKAKASFWPKDDVVQVSIDLTPTQGSVGLVTSGGVYNAVQSATSQPLTTTEIDTIMANVDAS